MTNEIVVNGDKCSLGEHEFNYKEFKCKGETLKSTNLWFENNDVQDWIKAGLLEEFKDGLDGYLEIGVNCGCSFFWVVENLIKHDSAEIYTIDPYKEAGRSSSRVEAGLKIASKFFLENIQKVKLQNHTHSYSDSNKHLMQLVLRGIRPSFNLVYVDGNHSFEGAMFDMMLSWKLLEEGGIMIVGDYNRQFRNGKKLVRPACNAFADGMSHEALPYYISSNVIMWQKSTKRRR